MKTLEIFCDGSCWNGQEDQPMGLGVAYFLDGIHLEKYNIALSISCEDAGGYTTSVLAELGAIELGLISLEEIKEKFDKIIVNSDNDFSIQVIHGYKQTTLPHLKTVIETIKQIKKENNTIEFKWISRDFNKHANALSREALGKKVKPEDKI